MSRTRIARGIEELRSEDPLDAGRTRRAGGGRKRIVDTDPTLVSDLDALLEPITAGQAGRQPPAVDLQEREQAHAELQALGHPVVVVSSTSCCTSSATPAGEPQEHRRRPTPGSGCAVQLPQRAGAQCSAAGSSGHFGRYQEEGVGRRVQERRQGVAAKGDPEQVKVHDFVIPSRARPSLRASTTEPRRRLGQRGCRSRHGPFAVNAIRSWWNRMGRSAYGGTGHLVITADAGAATVREPGCGSGSCSASRIAPG